MKQILVIRRREKLLPPIRMKKVEGLGIGIVLKAERDFGAAVRRHLGHTSCDSWQLVVNM